jgi:hypothetical protein
LQIILSQMPSAVAAQNSNGRAREKYCLLKNRYDNLFVQQQQQQTV